MMCKIVFAKKNCAANSVVWLTYRLIYHVFLSVLDVLFPFNRIECLLLETKQETHKLLQINSKTNDSHIEIYDCARNELKNQPN